MISHGKLYVFLAVFCDINSFEKTDIKYPFFH